MTSNRMGSTRRKSNRRVWLTGTLTLGALAASGGVATAALTHSPEHAGGATARVAASLPATKIVPASKTPQANGGAKSDLGRARGPVCLRLDKKAQQAVAAAAAASHGSVVVPVGKIDVVPCPKPKVVPPAPVKAAAATKTTTATKATTPGTVAPAPAPAPAVSSSAS